MRGAEPEKPGGFPVVRHSKDVRKRTVLNFLYSGFVSVCVSVCVSFSPPSVRNFIQWLNFDFIFAAGHLEWSNTDHSSI